MECETHILCNLLNKVKKISYSQSTTLFVNTEVSCQTVLAF